MNKETKKAVTMKVPPSIINLLSLVAPYQKSNLSDFVSNAIQKKIQESAYTQDLKSVFEKNQKSFQKIIHESIKMSILEYLREDDRFEGLEFKNITLKLIEAAQEQGELDEFSETELRNEALIQFKNQVYDLLFSDEKLQEKFNINDSTKEHLNAENILLLLGLNEMFENEVQIQTKIFSMQYSIDVITANALEHWVDWISEKNKSELKKEPKKQEEKYQKLIKLAKLVDNLYKDFNETIWYNTFEYLCKSEFKDASPKPEEYELFFDKIFNQEKYEIFNSIDTPKMIEKIESYMELKK